ncbi:MAG: DinB family protein [Gemmatimonadaceae bacterium]|nr:DinB family protein [Gemmatimonadaceae bacterium]
MTRILLARDLRALAREVDAYPNDELVWRTAPGIANSGGTLVLHLLGNLQHFIGAVLGGTGYVRDREAEFATRDLTRAELRRRIDAAAEAVDATLARLAPEQWEAEYPVPIAGRKVGTADFLVHLVAHLAYHLGQIDYHRRTLVPDAGTVDAMSIGDLPEYAP